jgi:REP element-mobilizing transposase RayT
MPTLQGSQTGVGNMTQTLVNVMLHVVFSTRERRNLILPDLEPHLHAYLGGILRKLHSPGFPINGTENHVHLLVGAIENHRSGGSDPYLWS